MRTINLARYMAELTTLYSFYRYSEAAFQDPALRERIKKEEAEALLPSMLPYLKPDLPDPQRAKALAKELISENVGKTIDTGMMALRRQILETAHATFEKFLCHVVRVYLHTFPEILMDIDKAISFRTVAELRDNAPIFDHVVEREVSHFSRRSLSEKKDYLTKRLKLTNQDDVWQYEGKELWKDIDRKRQAIVHQEEVPEISPEGLLEAISYFHRAMMILAMRAQVDQGIQFSWWGMSDYVKSKDQPTLKP